MEVGGTDFPITRDHPISQQLACEKRSSLQVYNQVSSMSYQVLARKYRPQRFSDVIGQEHVTRTLKNAIDQQRIAHGYIFSGHRGIGKTTIARILAMALNCRSSERPTAEPCGTCDSCIEIRAGSSVDVIEIDAATNRGIDEIRELREAARYRPARDRYKIYILDEAHQITDAAFNALLKTLEEPPGHIVFMMATTQPEDIPQTIRSRCQNFSFRAVKFDEIVSQLAAIAQKEKINADPAALALLAEAGEGSMRDALSILDQVIAGSEGRVSVEQVQGLIGGVGTDILEQLLETVRRGSANEALQLLDGQITSGQNPSHLAKQLVRLLRNVLVAKVAGRDSALLQISSDERARAERIAEGFSEEDLARFLQIMLRTHDELGYRQEQRFHLEMGVLKLVHAQRLLPLEQVLSQVAEPPKTGSGTRPGTSAPGPGRPPGAPLGKTEGGKTESGVSPFAADRARKDRGPEPEMSSPAAGQSQLQAVAVAVARAPEPSDDAKTILGRVIEGLESSGNHNLAATLENASVRLQGNELVVSVAQPASVIPFIMSSEQKGIATMAASAAAGRPIKLTLLGGASSGDGPAPPRMPRNGGSARGRAAEDPVVRRMQEKFGAEIRTVIDHRDKN
jgi:DNA polymerase-3 subunit gamma/tau